MASEIRHPPERGEPRLQHQATQRSHHLGPHRGPDQQHRHILTGSYGPEFSSTAEAGATNITGESPRLIDAIEGAETTSLEAVRKFVDTVNDSIPDLGGGEDGPRRKIIDAAFKMTEHLVGASNRVAQSMLDITEKHLNDADKKAKASTK